MPIGKTDRILTKIENKNENKKNHPFIGKFFINKKTVHGYLFRQRK